MEYDVWKDVQATVAAALGTPPDRVRIPARRFAAGCYRPEGEKPAPEAFGTLYGAPLVSSVLQENGWVLLTFTDAFYNACVDRAIAAFPPATDDLNIHALNRMLQLSRHGGAGCPPIPAMQHALLLACGPIHNRSNTLRACFLLESVFSSVPPRERRALLARSGAYGDACARLLARRLANADPGDTTNV